MLKISSNFSFIDEYSDNYSNFRWNWCDLEIIFVDGGSKDGTIEEAKNQVETRIFYPPIHRLSPYKDKDVKFKITSEISDRGIWLPSSVTLKEKDIEYVCKKIISFSKKNSF